MNNEVFHVGDRVWVAQVHLPLEEDFGITYVVRFAVIEGFDGDHAVVMMTGDTRTRLVHIGNIIGRSFLKNDINSCNMSVTGVEGEENEWWQSEA